MANLALAQEEIRIEIDKKNILLEESFTLQVIFKNTPKTDIRSFPNFSGFSKGAKQKSYSKSVLGYVISQHYIPTQEGTFKLPSSIININNKDYAVEAFTMVVGNMKEEDDVQPLSNISISSKNAAFLGANLDKTKVYVGEGYKVALSLYVPENNTLQLDFADDLNAQVDAIAKKIKSADCLEQRIPISDIAEQRQTVNGKMYLVYTIFEAIYYPLNNKTITIPEIELRMLQQSRKNGKKETIAYKSASQKITVVQLPEHPLMDKVAVGDFSLNEVIDTKKINTGKSFVYSFKISGQGNFSTVTMNNLSNDSFFDFYPPEIREKHQNGQINDEKLFKYRILPKSAGKYEMNKYFSWVFFNTKKRQYDTLKSALKIQVLGTTIVDNNTETITDIFTGLDKVDTSNIFTNYQEVIKNIFNFVLVCMLLGSLYLFNWQKKA